MSGDSTHNAPYVPDKRSYKPFFVIGYPRSGTTLLLHFLMSSGHFPKYRFSETHYFSSYYKRFGSLDKKANFEKFRSKLLNSRWFPVTGIDFEELIASFDGAPLQYENIFLAIMEEMSRAQDKDRWLEKTPWHILYARDIKRTIPDSKFILIIRDPRDVALSIDNYGWNKGILDGPVRAAIAWAWHMRNVTRDLQRWPDDVTFIKYEDLVENTDETAAKIASFIDADIDLELIKQNSMGVMQSANTSFKNDQNSNPVYRWKTSGDSELIGKLDYALGSNLAAYGYEKSSAPPPGLIDKLGITALRLAYNVAKRGRQIAFPLVRR